MLGRNLPAFGVLDIAKVAIIEVSDSAMLPTRYIPPQPLLPPRAKKCKQVRLPVSYKPSHFLGLPKDLFVNLVQHETLPGIINMRLLCKTAKQMLVEVPVVKMLTTIHKATCISKTFSPGYISGILALPNNNVVFLDSKRHFVCEINKKGAGSFIIGDNFDKEYHPNSIRGGDLDQATVYQPIGIAQKPSQHALNQFIISDAQHRMLCYIDLYNWYSTVVTVQPTFFNDVTVRRTCIPGAICYDHNGDLLICDPRNNVICKRTDNGVLSLFAGQLSLSDSNAASCAFTQLNAIACNPVTKDIYIADGKTIKYIRSGAVTVVHTRPKCEKIAALTFDEEGNLYFVARAEKLHRVGYRGHPEIQFKNGGVFKLHANSNAVVCVRTRPSFDQISTAHCSSGYLYVAGFIGETHNLYKIKV